MKRFAKLLLVISMVVPLAACNASSGTATLTFDANGGFFGADPNKTTVSVSGRINTLIASSSYSIPNYDDKDYSFAGWSESPEGKTVLGDELFYPYFDSTIYASWRKKVTVSYVTNIENISHAAEEGYEGKGLSLWEPDIPDSADYSFAGWYTDNTFSVEYDKASFPADDLTLYGLFEDFPTVSLHYATDDIVTFTGKAGSRITENYKEVTIPPGKIFAGWYYDQTINETTSAVRFFFDYMPGVSLDVYPRFETPVNIYYYIGEDHTGTIPAIKGLAGTPIPVEMRPDLSAIDYRNYTMEGWFYTDSEGHDVQFMFETYPEKDITLTAHWKAYPTIVFDCRDYPTLAAPATLSLMSGTIIPDLPTMDLPRYEFLYWATKSATGEYELFDETYMPITDVILYPIFTAHRKINIVYTYSGEALNVSDNQEFYLTKTTDSITIDWWNENIILPIGYCENGIYNDIYDAKNENQVITKYSLPQSPQTDAVYYVNLAKEIKVNFYVPENPGWYFDGSEKSYLKQFEMTGGEGMMLAITAENRDKLKKDGYEFAGFYEDAEYAKFNSMAVFPDIVDTVNPFEISIYVKYTKI